MMAAGFAKCNIALALVMDGVFSAPCATPVAFDRMTAIQLRHMAELEPHLAEQLRCMADKLDADAADIERHLG